MKRILSLILLITLIFTLCPTSAYAVDTMTDSQINQVTQNMMNHISNRDYTLLVNNKYRQYPNFIEEFNSNIYATATMELINELIDSGSVLDIEEDKYMEVLINIMAVSEHDNASDMAIQNQQDNLKTFQDYAMDIAEMGANVATVMTGNTSLGSLGENLSTAISGLDTLAKNTDNWIGALSNLETIVQNYEKHEIFLSAIENESEGNLKQAAAKLKNAMSTAMKIKLDTYTEISNENFKNYSEFFFEDIFFKTLKNTQEYATDDAFAFFVDGGSSIVGNISVLNASWELGKQIGTLIGNIAVGGENLINRVREIKVATDIRRALSLSMINQVAQFTTDYSSNEAQEMLYEEVRQYVALSEYIINCDMRGEYCMYSIVANDAGLLSWFNKKSAEEAEQWYYDSCELLQSTQKKYFENILNYSNDIPSNAVVFNNHFYTIYDFSPIASAETNTWENAFEYCEGVNGYLATITSKEENDFLFDYMTEQGYDSAYFGLTDSSWEGHWEWKNGTKSDYTNWALNEPTGRDGANYAKLSSDYPDGAWSDGVFSSSDSGGTAFICEWEGTFNSDNITNIPVRTTSDERDIVLVLDVSGSMSGTPMNETKKASTKFINTILDENASIGVVTYDNTASMLSDFAVDKTYLTDVITNISDGGGTNIESGLAEAKSMLDSSNAKKKIIILMSDGEPNSGKTGDELVAYADSLKNNDILIYTLGFFENMGNEKSSAQNLMEKLASDGCHYEVASADDLVFFFEDMADQINGQKYIYIRIACPVDVSVTYSGETLCSAKENLNDRTAFGTLTFEDSENEATANEDDRIKVLRLKEGADYDVQIVGTGRGMMDYTIGFMDENGNYSDFRRFENVKITKQTIIDTIATVSDESILNIDQNGDGKYDVRLRAEENGYGEEIKIPIWIYAGIGVGIVLLVLVGLAVVKIRKGKKRDKVHS
ncbi:VWA domain-containing protein [Agathobaculum sp. LCP25S3_E8]|uniref:VWA domain-containing protein n=1 Tax=Agathobaculum sp. LCP25S3_E8 TaxID=3438735 RepID=UPI003F8F6FCA